MTLGPSDAAAEWASDNADEAVRHEELTALADELLAAYRTGEPIEPLRDRVANFTLNDAYYVQTEQLKHHLAAGETLAGHKVGLTSLAMQQQLGVDEPDFGFFLKTMVHYDGATLPADDFISPKVEPEFGFVLTEDLEGPGVTVEQAKAAIGKIYPAIEIIDSRIRDWDIKLVDTVADNASCGAIAVSKTPLKVSVDELSEVQCTLKINGEAKVSGTGAAVMGDPIAPLAWLANTLGAQGVALKAGQLILPGSFTKALPVVAGEEATADFGELGSLTIAFS